MHWTVGMSLLGLGVTVFFSAAQMIGWKWPRWVLWALGFTGVALMLVWPLSLAVIGLQSSSGPQRRHLSLAIAIAVGSLTGGAISGVLWWMLQQDQESAAPEASTPAGTAEEAKLKGSLSAMRVPGPGSQNTRLLSIRTEGRKERVISIGIKPIRLLVEPSNTILTAKDLPKDIWLGSDSIVIRQFTADGLVVDERRSVGAELRITVLEGEALPTAPSDEKSFGPAAPPIGKSRPEAMLAKDSRILDENTRKKLVEEYDALAQELYKRTIEWWEVCADLYLARPAKDRAIEVQNRTFRKLEAEFGRSIANVFNRPKANEPHRQNLERCLEGVLINEMWHRKDRLEELIEKIRAGQLSPI